MSIVELAKRSGIVSGAIIGTWTIVHTIALMFLIYGVGPVVEHAVASGVQAEASQRSEADSLFRVELRDMHTQLTQTNQTLQLILLEIKERR